jgi:adenylate kinase family enzyme
MVPVGVVALSLIGKSVKKLRMYVGAELEKLSATFKYASESDRMEVALRAMRKDTPPLRILVLGSPASGKATMVRMLCTAYRSVAVSTGDLLRAALRAETVEEEFANLMNAGGLVPDELLWERLTNRLAKRDALSNGWILDGYPRTETQAKMLVESTKIDAVVVLSRPDDVTLSMLRGRLTDPFTGAVYHPDFAPPPCCGQGSLGSA